MIGQGIDDDVGIILGNGICYFVDKADQRAGMAALLLINPGAFRALAGSAPVILADGENRRLRVLLDLLAQPLDDNTLYVGIGQAQLGIDHIHAPVHILSIAAVKPLAIHHGEIFRMLVEELKHRHKMVKGMHKALIEDGAAVLLVQLVAPAVQAALRGELIVVIAHVPEYLAVFKGRDHLLVHLADGQVRPLRHMLHRVREEPAPQHVLQESIHRMQHRPVVLAQDEQPVPYRLEDIPVVLQPCQLRLSRAPRLPHADLRRVLVPDGSPACRVDRQVRSRHLVEIAGQHLRRPPGGGAGLVGHDDMGAGCAMVS